MFLHDAGKFKMPVMIGGFHRHLAPEMKHAPASVLNQRLCRKPSAFLMVHRNHRNILAQVPVQGNNWLMDLLIFFHCQGMGARNHPVHNMPVQHVQILQFSIKFLFRCTQHHLEAGLIKFSLHMIHEFRKKRIGYIGNKDCYDSGPLMVQVPCKLVGRIVQRFHRLLNPVPGLLRHISAVIEHPGYRTKPHVGQLGNIPHTRHIFTSSVSYLHFNCF